MMKKQTKKKQLCLKVSVRSAKTNILFDGAIIAKVKLIFLSCKDTRLFSQENMISNTFWLSMQR